MNKSFVAIISLIIIVASTDAQTIFNKKIKLLDNEKWWGGNVVDAPNMPYGNDTIKVNLDGYIKGNQAQPLLISNKGRVVWSDSPIDFSFSRNVLTVKSKYDSILVGKSGNSLKDAFLYSSKNYFPSSGKIPDQLLFTNPQYNTWIELMYDQNQEDILKYAHSIINNGYPAGVLMIDDNWNRDYGEWEFKTKKFPNPKGMIDELHSLGFKVMLWVCPFVSPDGPVYRKYRNKKFFLLENCEPAKPKMVQWWNGVSAVLDFTNPKAVEWFNSQLNYLINEYGVDGFKFDAGDPEFYAGNVLSSINSNEQCEQFAKIGLNFPLNEYRAGWKMAGKPLVQRLRDKQHNWDDLQKLIPGLISQGLMGYAFTCPDMIGGGEFSSFLDDVVIDEELIIRSAQCQALAPMMQFSVAPWRVLNKKYNSICRSMANLHVDMGEEILSIAKESAKTGEPIVRSLEYEYPNQGYGDIKDQFLLGNSILVAPVLKKNVTKIKVVFPIGEWKDVDGNIIEGPIIKEIDAPLEILPWFRKVEK